MRPFVKNAIALALAGAVTASAATPTLARSWKPWAAAGAGFVAGAAVGSAIASSRAYYGPGYAYSGYAYYSPGYAYAPEYYDAYAYSPAPTVTYVSPGAYHSYNGCVGEGPYGKPDYNSC